VINTKNELNNIATEINRLLSEYIEIHNEVFKFSWRKIIPIPFIFKAIDFKGLQSKAGKILITLENSNELIAQLLTKVSSDQSCFAHFLSEYCLALIETVSIFEKMLFQLYLKSQNSGDYSLSEHNKLSKGYEEAVRKYYSMGNRLNELYSEFNQPQRQEGYQ